jgi:hypothetical protein
MTEMIPHGLAIVKTTKITASIGWGHSADQGNDAGSAISIGHRGASGRFHRHFMLDSLDRSGTQP